jgi:hypothetical protein
MCVQPTNDNKTAAFRKKGNKSARSALTEPTTPTPFDVLCGSGIERVNQPGNELFTVCVLKYVEQYTNALTKKRKMLISKTAFDELTELGVRFLKKHPSHQYWYVADQKVGRDRIGHFLRQRCIDKNEKKGLQQTSSMQYICNIAPLSNARRAGRVIVAAHANLVNVFQQSRRLSSPYPTDILVSSSVTDEEQNYQSAGEAYTSMSCCPVWRADANKIVNSTVLCDVSVDAASAELASPAISEFSNWVINKCSMFPNPPAVCKRMESFVIDVAPDACDSVKFQDKDVSLIANKHAVIESVETSLFSEENLEQRKHTSNIGGSLNTQNGHCYSDEDSNWKNDVTFSKDVDLLLFEETDLAECLDWQ